MQIWVPDTRLPDFAAECQRQSKRASKADGADLDMLEFMDEVLADMDDLPA